MNTKSCLAVVACVAISIVTSSLAGPINPPVGPVASTGKTTCTLTCAGAGDSLLALRFNNAPPDMAELEFMAPGYAPGTAQLVRTEVLTHLAPFRVLRFMDWGRTNTSPVATWAERPRLDAAGFRGVRFHWMGGLNAGASIEHLVGGVSGQRVVAARSR